MARDPRVIEQLEKAAKRLESAAAAIQVSAASPSPNPFQQNSAQIVTAIVQGMAPAVDSLKQAAKAIQVGAQQPQQSILVGQQQAPQGGWQTPSPKPSQTQPQQPQEAYGPPRPPKHDASLANQLSAFLNYSPTLQAQKPPSLPSPPPPPKTLWEKTRDKLHDLGIYSNAPPLSEKRQEFERTRETQRRALLGDEGARSALSPDQMRAGSKRVSLEAAKENVGSMLQGDRNFMGNAFGAMKNFLGVFGDNRGIKMTQGLLKMGEGFGAVAEKIQRMGDRIAQTDRGFAEVSASMAHVFAEAQYRDIRLAQERGERRSDSARIREEARSELERARAPRQDLGANITNYFNAGIDRTLAALERFVAGIPGFFPEGQAGEPGEIDPGQWMEQVARAEWARSYNRPLRFGGNQQQGPQQ